MVFLALGILVALVWFGLWIGFALEDIAKAIRESNQKV